MPLVWRAKYDRSDTVSEDGDDSFTLNLDYNWTTLGELLQRFYRFNTGFDLEKSWITYALNPEPFTPSKENIYFFVHYGGYLGRIDINPNDQMGAHRCRLFYDCQQIKARLWIASAQLDPTFFFQERRILDRYQWMIDEEGWYQTPREVNKRVIQ